ncbi:DUF4416 family protein, partial [candidate division KSB1 bacterium]
LKKLSENYGKIDLKLEPYTFDYTDYYKEELGADLKKLFISFAELTYSEKLPEIKIQANKIENEYAKNNKRKVNIDPGYITSAKLVLATTKNYSHRIHLAKGIFGDVHLNVYKGKFKSNPWSFSDYKEEFVLEFFDKVRKIYLESLPYQK